MDKIDKLKQIKQLFDDGTINEQEFNQMKLEIIGTDSNSSNVFSEKISNEEKPTINESKSKFDKKSYDEIIAKFKKESTLINGIYVTEDENLVKYLKFIDRVSGKSMWGGIFKKLGIGNAEIEIVQNAKDLDAEVILITEYSTFWGVKLNGKAYKRMPLVENNSKIVSKPQIENKFESKVENKNNYSVFIVYISVFLAVGGYIYKQYYYPTKNEEVIETLRPGEMLPSSESQGPRPSDMGYKPKTNEAESSNSDSYSYGDDGRLYESNACGLCNGTGIEKNKGTLSDEYGRTCPMCDGRGVKSY
jgi:hypothetical protein